MPELLEIPLSKLSLGVEVNSRQTGQKNGVAALAASIKAHGLLSPLVVRLRAGMPDSYEIVDGNTRFLALKKLAGKNDEPVPAIVVKYTDGGALEASLAANVVRTPLHPVDEYEAYARLITDGETVADIAERFAVTEKWVKQRLQLANLAPELRTAWREGKMTTDMAEAFSCVPDHARQLAHWKTVAKDKNKDSWERSPRSIRNEMLRTVIHSGDRRVVVVGIDAYREAGGTFTEDLFEDAQTITDEALLDKLFAEKLEAIFAELVSQGWAWASTTELLGVGEWECPKLDVRPWMTEDEITALKAAKYSHQQDTATRPARERALADPEARAKSGVIVTVDWNGEIRKRGLFLLPEAAKAEAVDDDPDDGEFDEEGSPSAPAAKASTADDGKPRLSQALHERVAQMATKAMRAAIATDQHVAICTLVAALQSKTGGYGGGDNPVRISGQSTEGGEAKKFDECFNKLLPIPTGMVLNQLVVIIARHIDFNDPKFDSGRSYGDWKKNRHRFLELLSGALPELSVRAAILESFDPDAYFSGCTGPQIDEAMAEMGAGKAKGKKAEKVTMATEAAGKTGWLPPELRTPHYEGPTGSNANG